MTLRLNSEVELKALMDRMKHRDDPIPDVVTKTSKYHNILCEANGITFRSKKERRRYLELVALRHAGECWFLMQVPFRLTGGVKYVLDFMVFWKDLKVTFEDTKGCRTEVYRIKKRQTEELYPIRITEL